MKSSLSRKNISDPNQSRGEMSGQVFRSLIGRGHGVISNLGREKQSPPKGMRVFAAYLILLGAFAFFSCHIEKFALYASSSKPYSILFTRHIHKGLSKENKKNIIFLGDSSLFYPPFSKANDGDEQEHTPALLERILNQEAPDLKAGVSEWAFPSASMYHYYCMFFKASTYSPDIIIVPINWNSFGTLWHFLAKDDYPELCALAPLFRGPTTVQDPFRYRGISLINHVKYKLQILSLYPIGFRRWTRDALLNLNPVIDRPEDGPVDMSERRRDTDRTFLQNAYPLDISQEASICHYMRALSEVATQHRTRILFYISPLNQEYLEAVEYFDATKFEESKEVVKASAFGEGVYCIDLSGLLSDGDFYDTLEHYLVPGREKLAKELAAAVIEILKEKQL